VVSLCFIFFRLEPYHFPRAKARQESETKTPTRVVRSD
jgi:hypothetical protein